MRQAQETGMLAASEAIFGSCARGRTDALSDRDILIVDDDREVLRARASVLMADGKSVAPYTFLKLEKLAVNGALFIQHLRLRYPSRRSKRTSSKVTFQLSTEGEL